MNGRIEAHDPVELLLQFLVGLESVWQHKFSQRPKLCHDGRERRLVTLEELARSLKDRVIVIGEPGLFLLAQAEIGPFQQVERIEREVLGEFRRNRLLNLLEDLLAVAEQEYFPLVSGIALVRYHVDVRYVGQLPGLFPNLILHGIDLGIPETRVELTNRIVLPERGPGKFDIPSVRAIECVTEEGCEGNGLRGRSRKEPNDGCAISGLVGGHFPESFVLFEIAARCLNGRAKLVEGSGCLEQRV